MRSARRVLDWLIALLLPCALVAANVWLLTSEAYVRWGLGRVPVPAGMTHQARDAGGLAITNYVVGRSGDGWVPEFVKVEAALAGTLPDDGIVERGDLGSPDAARSDSVADEMDHLQDVSWVLFGLYGAGTLELVLIALVTSTRLGSGWAAARRTLARGGLITLTLVALVGLGMATGWERTFVLFHEILFPQGNWAFPADSLLIQIFPNQFWFEAAAVLVALTMIEAAALVWWGRRGNAPKGPNPNRRVPAAADGSP